MAFVFVDTVDEVLRHALRDGVEPLPEAAPARAVRTVLNQRSATPALCQSD